MKSRKLAFISILLLLSCPNFGQDKLPSKIILSRSVIDLGQVKKGETKRFEIVAKNTSLQRLIIQNIDLPCSCLKAKWSKKPINISDSTTLYFSYRSREVGAFYKEITIISNDNSTTTFKIKGSVK